MYPQVSEIEYHFMMKKKQATCMLIACPELDLVTKTPLSPPKLTPKSEIFGGPEKGEDSSLPLREGQGGSKISYAYIRTER